MNPVILIVGAGISGCSTAIRLLKQGISPSIVDRATFPRDTVGEGLSPAVGVYLQELGIDQTICSGPFTKKRSLQLVARNGGKAYTKIDFDNRWYGNGAHRYPWGFNVRRRDFDMVFMDRAYSLGADIRLNTTAKEFACDRDGAIVGVHLTNPNGSSEFLETNLIIDCSGRTSALATQLAIRAPLENVYDGQWANFAVRCHFTNVDMGPLARGNPDYDAATVNILPDQNCWYWFIPLQPEGIISVGFVARSKMKSIFEGYPDKVRGYRALFDNHPVLKEVLRNAKMSDDIVATARLGHMNHQMIGDGFLCVGDAGFFADPSWGTGVTISLATSKLAATTVVEAHRSGSFKIESLRAYERAFLQLIHSPFNNIRAFNYYYNDVDYINWLVARLADRRDEMDLIGAVAFDYRGHTELTKWTYRVARQYILETGSVPIMNAVSGYNFNASA